MSVIVENINSMKRFAFTKGSPEKLLNICNKTSIPSNTNSILEINSLKGFR
jgi:magnesium-transporting ATPase (P-type)